MQFAHQCSREMKLASLVTTEVLAVDHMMTTSIDIAVPSAGDAGHSEVKT